MESYQKKYCKNNENRKILFDFIGMKTINEEIYEKKGKINNIKSKNEVINQRIDINSTLKQAFDCLFNGKNDIFIENYKKLESIKDNLYNSTKYSYSKAHNYNEFVIPNNNSTDNKEVSSNTLLCNKCYENPYLINFIISNSKGIYLSHPFKKSLCDYHFYLSSFKHYHSSICMTDPEYAELINYTTSVTNFYNSNGYSSLFIETSREINNKHHFVIECFPIKRELISETKEIFKKSLSEAIDSDRRDNKVLIDTYSWKGNIKKIINSNFPFVSVNFNNEGGYLHIIEQPLSIFNDDSYIKENLIAVIDDVTIFDIKSKEKKSIEEVIEKVILYKKDYLKYDWVYKK